MKSTIIKEGANNGSSSIFTNGKYEEYMATVSLPEKKIENTINIGVVKVYGVKWDEADDLNQDVEIIISENVNVNDTEELECFISDELSNKYGFCHLGWGSYKIIKP